MVGERTFVMIKPDGVQRGLVGDVISRLERKGLKLVGMKMLWLSREKAEKQYAIHQGKAFFEELIGFVTSSPVVVMVWEGERAIESVRQVVGATDPLKSTPGSIRGDLALTVTKNIIHAADSPETARMEIALYFSESELFDYQRCDEVWTASEGS